MKHLILKTSQAGNKQGEFLVVFHGWGMNSSVWNAIKPALEEQYLVTWIDLPGHGINHDVVVNSLDEMLELTLPIIPDKSHLLGWSLGGLVAQAVSKASPDSVKSMTLVASTPRFSQADSWENAMSNQTLNSFAKSLENDIEGTIKKFIALQFLGIKQSKELQRELLADVLSQLPDKLALKSGLDILKSADFRKHDPKIPQHWILASQDRLVPKNVINDLKLLRPNAQITLLENTGHAPFMTHPQEFMNSFTDFMEAHV